MHEASPYRGDGICALVVVPLRTCMKQVPTEGRGDAHRPFAPLRTCMKQVPTEGRCALGVVPLRICIKQVPTERRGDALPGCGQGVLLTVHLKKWTQISNLKSQIFNLKSSNHNSQFSNLKSQIFKSQFSIKPTTPLLFGKGVVSLVCYEKFERMETSQFHFLFY